MTFEELINICVLTSHWVSRCQITEKPWDPKSQFAVYLIDNAYNVFLVCVVEKKWLFIQKFELHRMGPDDVLDATKTTTATPTTTTTKRKEHKKVDI